MQNLIQVDTLNQVNPFALPSLPIERISQLPEKSCIYFVYRKMAVLYIGKSTNLKSRWMAHQKHEFLQDIDSVCISWLECDSDQLDATERFFIDQYLPRLNKQYVPSSLLTHDGIEPSAKPFPYDVESLGDAFEEATDNARQNFHLILEKALKAYMRFAVDVFSALDDSQIDLLKIYVKQTIALLTAVDTFNRNSYPGRFLLSFFDVPRIASKTNRPIIFDEKGQGYIQPMDRIDVNKLLLDSFFDIEEKIFYWIEPESRPSDSPE